MIITCAIIIGIIVGIKQKGNSIGGKIEQIGSNGQVISKTSQLRFSNMKTISMCTILRICKDILKFIMERK